MQEVFDKKDIDDSKAFAAIGYIGILCFVPLLLKKDSPYAQFHGKQGLVLFIAEVVIFFINIIPVLGQLVWLFASVLFLILSIFGLLKAWNGESWELPVLGEYAKKIKL
jgi:fumarate reductase subunit D